ncbi:hypothetical protein EVAR_47013_1 [Eumeta japonica]|uniref:Uncharacterized protein n=1 Tax=Eumeta variegata TaxID=151549 RepID=A0A4C1XFD1_EUMVA|nr:hypothetical protein EVAR_47013_1 [Eumeta japonica]
MKGSKRELSQEDPETFAYIILLFSSNGSSFNRATPVKRRWELSKMGCVYGDDGQNCQLSTLYKGTNLLQLDRKATSRSLGWYR